MKKLHLFLVWTTACLLVMSLFLSACSGRMVKASEVSATPGEAMERAMGALKVLDLKTFNDYTDNYVSTQRNWFGIPVRREYKVFNELLQPGLKDQKRYQWNKELAEKIVENLSWEIGEVSETGDEALINITLTNKDLTDVAGIYTINLLKGMIDSEGTGMMHLVKEVYNLSNDGGEMSAIVAQMDQTCSFAVTVQAKREDGEWIICLSEDFIEAFMGNIGGSLSNWEYSEEVEKQIKDLEQEFEQKADQIEKGVEEWAERLFE